MLRLTDLKKAYSGTTVVDIPELIIEKGQAVGLVGNNGAGKTTLFRIILDLVRPENGEVLSKDINVALSESWKDYTASYLDEGFLIDYLTPEEYFYFICGLHNIPRPLVDNQLLKFDDFFNSEILKKGKYIRDLSKGNQSKVGLAAAMLQEPELLILDEPFANIDPSTQIRLKTILKEINTVKNITTFISSHDLSHVTEVCQRILLMEKGKIVKDIKTDSNTLKELEQYFSVLQ